MMAEQASDEVWVITTLGRDRQRIERGLGDVVAEGTALAVPVVALKRNMQRFLGQLREILASGDQELGGFEIDRVEVSAQINADGQVCLLGSGLKLAAGGGLTFVLKRRAV